MSVRVANFKSWNRAAVMTFFEAYDFEQDEIKKIRDLGLRGLMLPGLSEAELVGWGLHPVLASYIFSIIKAAGILSESARSPTAPPPTVKDPHYTRDRWLDLNPILDQNKKAKTLAEGKSTAYSHVSWDDIKLVYEPVMELTTIPPKQIPDNTLTRLHDYLYTASHAFISTSPVKDAQLLHFIAPMLVHISPLLNDMKILIESDIPGKNIHVHGHFEFVVRRQNIRVCVIEAKRGDLFKGIAQNLLGCEAVAEIESLDCVFGIVTTYTEWVFLKSFKNRVEYERTTLPIVSGVATKEGLNVIVGKIYSLLSGEG